jgi:RNA polymerase sigma factor (sigma-70 family)
MVEDAELLRRYTHEKSETAFAELVTRHVNFVYASALRRLSGDAHAAADVTQRVFTVLARKAGTLDAATVLPGWLFSTTRNLAAAYVRAESRRRKWEKEAHLMQAHTAGDPTSAEWERLRPMLEGALDQLGQADREAVLLRFFAGRSFREIGATLRVSDAAARMRVERALDKLQRVLAKRGVTSTASALGLTLVHQATAVSAPAGLAASVSTAALTGAGAIGIGSATAMLHFMSASKIALTLAAAGVLAVGFAVYQSHQADVARDEFEAAQREHTVWSARRAGLQTEIETEQSRLAAVPPTPAAVDTIDPDRAEQRRALEQEAGIAAREFFQTRFKAENAAYLRSLGATAQQIDQAAAAYGQRYQDYTRGPTLSPDKDFPELRAIIGDAAAERWHQNATTGMMSATTLIKDLAAAQFFTNEPFTSEQVDQLAAIVMTHYDRKNTRWPGAYAGPTSYRLEGIGWDNVVRDAERILSARQMDSLRALAARGKNANLYAAARKQSSK